MFRKIKAFLLPLLAVLLSSCSYTFYPANCDVESYGRLRKVSVIAPELNETSGLVSTDDTFITFNDSGGEAALYAFDREGTVLQKTMIAHSHNADWEDIAFDGRNYFIADVGNNFGRRDTLVIYKVPAAAIGKAGQAEATDSITFSYDEEITRSETGWYSHNCEAIFVYNDSIYLFAKDWVSQDTRIYVIPAHAGHYHIKSRVTYAVDALITGADIDPERREVVLIGYRNYIPVLIRYSFLEDPCLIECGGKVRKFPGLLGTQTEGICYSDAGQVYVSAEKSMRKQALFRVYW